MSQMQCKLKNSEGCTLFIALTNINPVNSFIHFHTAFPFVWVTGAAALGRFEIPHGQ